MFQAALDSGEALERFRKMVEAQGGDPHVADDPWSVLPSASVVAPLLAERTGILASMATKTTTSSNAKPKTADRL